MVEVLVQATIFIPKIRRKTYIVLFILLLLLLLLLLLNKFQRMCSTISRALQGKTQLSTQIKCYKVMAVPVLIYGSENWSLNRSDKRKIEAAEMKFLRPMAVYIFWDKK